MDIKLALPSTRRIKRCEPFEHRAAGANGVSEDDSLDLFISRITLGLYNHFRALGGNHAEAARLMRINRNSLYKRIKTARLRLSGLEVTDDDEDAFS